MNYSQKFSASQLPAALPSPRSDSLLVLRFEGSGVVVSENQYEITLATPGRAEGTLKGQRHTVLRAIIGSDLSSDRLNR